MTQLAGGRTGIWTQNYVTPEYEVPTAFLQSQSESVDGRAPAVLIASRGSAFSGRKSMTCTLQRATSPLKLHQVDGSSQLKPIYCFTLPHSSYSCNFMVLNCNVFLLSFFSSWIYYSLFFKAYFSFENFAWKFEQWKAAASRGGDTW